jgi:NAD(P)-dependent dehydrogenase (short-subunit alcohol dehydrogenase family)
MQTHKGKLASKPKAGRRSERNVNAGGIVVVTGSAGGIGGAVLRQIATAKDLPELVTIGVDVGPTSIATIGIEGDVASEQTWTMVCESIAKLNLPVIGLVCAAGVVSEYSVRDLSPGEFLRVVNTSLTGTYLAVHSLYHPLLQGKASVVALSSGYARRGYPHGSHYAAAKAGVEGFVRSIALEVANDGVRVNAVSPGPVETAMTAHFSTERLRAVASAIPQGRLGTADEIANVIRFLLGPDSAHMTGQVLQVNGGLYFG